MDFMSINSVILATDANRLEVISILLAKGMADPMILKGIFVLCSYGIASGDINKSSWGVEGAKCVSGGWGRQKSKNCLKCRLVKMAGFRHFVMGQSLWLGSNCPSCFLSEHRTIWTSFPTPWKKEIKKNSKRWLKSGWLKSWLKC